MDEGGEFRFPAQMSRKQAEAMLAEAYAELSAGKLLRRALQVQREAGYDPPSDVQYVCEPAIDGQERAWTVSLSTDIMVHEEFEGVDECTEIFEDVLAHALLERLERKARDWNRKPKA